MEEEKKEEQQGSYPKGPEKNDPSASRTPLMDPLLARPKSKLNSIQKDTIKLSFWSKLGRLILSLCTFSAQSILFICFLALAAVYCLRSIHDDYFVTMVERARRTDDDLLEEYTYYDRSCNVADVTAGVKDAKDLYIQEDSKNHGVDQMMTHGAVLFPDLLSPQTVEELREYIVTKNIAVKGTAAEFPMSQGHQRISYGIEGTEHPSISRALKEIHDNIELKHLLEGLLGVNPALTEITAITASYGCKAQAWHPDTKPDGNGVLFGRTYSHSYSLFMPLQNTTGAMGATDLCAGTHYCSSMDLHDMCTKQRIGMHQVSGQGFWPAGSAALFNQQVWHRGAKHSDPDASDRVVFIVSFLARPNDTRQLSRGTYFHMKWNMWGHTWADLKDSMRFMSWPWNIFTCLHIWRPASHGWGYDLITASAMRIANNQLGCEPGDLERFLDVLDRAGFPSWLDGTINMRSRRAWQIYLSETIANYWNFLVKVNSYALGAYFAIVGAVMIVQKIRGRPVFLALWGASKGVLLSHILVLFLAAEVLLYVRNAPWAKELSAGRMLMRPFPPVMNTFLDDPTVSLGPTTLPNRRDVLFGGRLDARTIGAYNRWLEFHPGNQEFLQGISALGGTSIYRPYARGLPPVFARAVVDAAMEPILSKGGRFLQQDYRTGDWLYLNPIERDEMVQQALYIGAEGPLNSLRKELNFAIGDARFGYSRETSMALSSLNFLRDLEDKLFGRFVNSTILNHGKSNSNSDETTNGSFFATVLPISSTKDSIVSPRDWVARWTAKELERPDYVVGEELSFKYTVQKTGKIKRAKATVIGIHQGGDLLDISLYGDLTRKLGVTQTVEKYSVEKIQPLQEGSLVLANYDDNEQEWYPGTILFMGPDGSAEIEYADGDFEGGVPPERYEPRYELNRES